MKKFLGYTVVNSKTKRFVDTSHLGIEESDDCYSTWTTKDGPQEILDEVDWHIDNRNNKSSRQAKRHRKYMKIAKLFVEAE